MAFDYRPIERSIFRAYDIRGVVGKQLDEELFYRIGRVLSCKLQHLNRTSIFLARDGRLSSAALAGALKQGLLDSGVHVKDLGAVPTPVMYYATSTTNTDSGLMVTGSHNPADYNGIKMVLAGKTLVQQDIEEIYEGVITGDVINGDGQDDSYCIIENYINRIINDIKLTRALKVVVDCGNGIAGPIVPRVLESLGCEVIPLFCTVDGNFPNHHPDPSEEKNLADVKAAIFKHKADIGLAFDGDADRLGVVTNLGEVIWPDRLLMLYAQDVLSTNPGATIVYDVKCSQHLAQVIRTAGGTPTMCPTGHSIVKGVMKANNAALAGEMSGHLFFKDRWFGFDDALYSACRLLEIIGKKEMSVSEQFAEIPNSINTPEIKIPIAEEDKFTFMTAFSEQAKFPDANIITIDGLRVEFENGWGLLRASNTTPCLVARFEATDEHTLKEIQTLFRAQLMHVDKSLTVCF